MASQLPQHIDLTNPNANPIDMEAPGNKRLRAPPSSLDHNQRSLEKDIDTEDEESEKIKEVMHKTSPTNEQEAGGKEDQVDGKENQGFEKEEKETESTNESVNSSEGGVSFTSKSFAKIVMADGPPLHTLETRMYSFLRSLRPDLRYSSRSELEKDIFKVHQEEKSRLKKILKKH